MKTNRDMTKKDIITSNYIMINSVWLLVITDVKHRIPLLENFRCSSLEKPDINLRYVNVPNGNYKTRLLVSNFSAN